MMRHRDDEPENDRDSRLHTVKQIGGLGVAMLAICIPLSPSIGHSSPLLAGLLPLAVIVGVGVTMITVWLTPRRNANARELAELQRQVAELNERLTNLETIDSFERRMAHREAAAQSLLQSQVASSPFPSTVETPPVIQQNRPQAERNT